MKMDQYTTPLPYGNLYNIETLPSKQPYTSPFDINEFINFPPSSQQTMQSWDSCNGPRAVPEL